MSRKRNKSVKPKSRRRNSYAQRHSRAKSANSLPQEVKDNDSIIITMIILIIAFVALLLCLIQGGGHTYDCYPGMPFGLSS